MTHFRCPYYIDFSIFPQYVHSAGNLSNLMKRKLSFSLGLFLVRRGGFSFIFIFFFLSKENIYEWINYIQFFGKLYLKTDEIWLLCLFNSVGGIYNNKFSFLFKSYLIYLTVELTGVRKVISHTFFFVFSFEWMNAHGKKSVGRCDLPVYGVFLSGNKKKNVKINIFVHLWINYFVDP